MNSLKEKFDQMEIAPDERVWEKISATMGRKARRRRMAAGAGAAVLVGLAAVLLLSNHETAPTESDAVVTAEANRQTVQQAAATQNLTAQASVEAGETVMPTATLDERTLATDQSDAAEVLTAAATASAQGAQTAAAEATAEATQKAPTTTVKATAAAKATATTKESTPTAAHEKKAAATVQQPTHTERNTTANPTKTTANMSATTANTGSTAEQKRQTAKSGGNDSLAIWIPNAFSPDDPTNDEVRCFKVFANNATTIQSYEIYIYSRTGRQVYHSRDINGCWDGTSKGYAQPMGTYVYVIEVKDAVKGLQHKRGTITLLR